MDDEDRAATVLRAIAEERDLRAADLLSGSAQLAHIATNVYRALQPHRNDHEFEAEFRRSWRCLTLYGWVTPSTAQPDSIEGITTEGAAVLDEAPDVKPHHAMTEPLPAAKVAELTTSRTETDWIECKASWFEPMAVGRYASALSNAAALARVNHTATSCGASVAKRHQS
jgi:hypothetical protein